MTPAEIIAAVQVLTQLLTLVLNEIAAHRSAGTIPPTNVVVASQNAAAALSRLSTLIAPTSLPLSIPGPPATPMPGKVA